jgi:hypothetical protein
LEFYRALLATLSVVNYTVAFEPGTLTYGIQVESAVESIQLTAALTAADVPLVALSAQDRNGQVGFCRHWFPATGDLGTGGVRGTAGLGYRFTRTLPPAWGVLVLLYFSTGFC